MKPYRIKHIPTGLYFQPRKHKGSHLSKNGKLYITNSNGIEREKEGKVFRVLAVENSKVQRNTEKVLAWSKCRYNGSVVQAFTLVSDWVKEEV